MRVYCVSCGAACEGEPGARVPCPACATPFDVPLDIEGAPASRGPLPSLAEPPPDVEPAPHVRPVPRQVPPGGPARTKVLVGKPTNGWAVASLIFGVMFCVPAVSPIMGIVCGLVAFSQLSADPEQKGHGTAGTGIVLSLIAAGLQVWIVASEKW
jgi:hypothetical protein